MPARPGLSVHREDALREAEASEAAHAAGINDALAWLIEHDRTDLALLIRADFVEEQRDGDMQ